MVPRFVKPLVQSARLLVVIAAALVCLLLLLQLPAFSQDSIAAPDVPGSLAGRVTNAAGDPLAGIEVRLCYLSSCSRTALTGPDGRYEFLGLPPATYLVEFRDPSRVYAPQFYGNVVDQALATGVVVSGNAVIDIDAVLAPGATVTGPISGVPAIGQSWYYVYLFRRSAREKLGTSLNVMRISSRVTSISPPPTPWGFHWPQGRHVVWIWSSAMSASSPAASSQPMAIPSQA
ncbi:MAG: hypothetical protein DCC57_20545 [Chloroflexi bacterium]|nr:MAG: hypothetical protein DCC57_20545 [Chloroflexota bacterium]